MSEAQARIVVRCPKRDQRGEKAPFRSGLLTEYCGASSFGLVVSSTILMLQGNSFFFYILTHRNLVRMFVL